MIPLASLSDRKAHRSWYKLMDKGEDGAEADGAGGEGAKEVGGEVDVQLRWAHNPQKERPVVHLNEVQSLVPLPGEGTASAGEVHERQRNELLVTLVGAKNLMVMDKAMLFGEGSTDPVVTLKVDGVGKVSEKCTVYVHVCASTPTRSPTAVPPHHHASPPTRHRTLISLGKAQSSIIKKSLEPVWKEHFSFAVEDQSDEEEEEEEEDGEAEGGRREEQKDRGRREDKGRMARARARRARKAVDVPRLRWR